MAMTVAAGLLVQGGAFAAEELPASSDSSEKKIGVGGDVQFVLPIGDLSDVTGPMLGPVLRGGYRVIPPLEITGRVGYLFAFSKSEDVLGGSVSSRINLLPIWVGARYFFMQPHSGVYAGGELGLNVLMGKVEQTAAGGLSRESSDTLTRFGFNVGAGYVISEDLPIDIRAQFMMLNLLGRESSTATVAGTTITTDEISMFGLGLSVGYTYSF